MGSFQTTRSICNCLQKLRPLPGSDNRTELLSYPLIHRSYPRSTALRDPGSSFCDFCIRHNAPSWKCPTCWMRPKLYISRLFYPCSYTLFFILPNIHPASYKILREIPASSDRDGKHSGGTLAQLSAPLPCAQHSGRRMLLVRMRMD